jgi:hypothetical protein
VHLCEAYADLPTFRGVEVDYSIRLEKINNWERIQHDVFSFVTKMIVGVFESKAGAGEMVPALAAQLGTQQSKTCVRQRSTASVANCSASRPSLNDNNAMPAHVAVTRSAATKRATQINTNLRASNDMRYEGSGQHD